jgi:hypothetical protein
VRANKSICGFLTVIPVFWNRRRSLVRQTDRNHAQRFGDKTNPGMWNVLPISCASAPALTEPLKRDHGTRTATVEPIPGPNSVQLEAIWDAEWQKNWIAAAASAPKPLPPRTLDERL